MNLKFINYLTFAEIGTAEGPCSEHCSHLICTMKRRDAEGPCLGCGQTIGYGAEVYLTDYTDSHGFLYELSRFWHRTCFEVHVSNVRQQLAKLIAAGVDTRGVPALESELDEARWIARQMKAWQIGEVSNDQLNSMRLSTGWPNLPKIHPNATKFRTVETAERIAEARKSEGVRRRGRRRAFLRSED